MGWGCAIAAMEVEKDRENLCLSLSDALQKSEGNKLEKGGVFRHRTTSAINNRLLSRMWLGILIIAQQLSTASAESICHALGRVRNKFDLIGLISAFGASAATKSLSYSVLNDCSLYVTGYIGPGSLGVAATLFQATGFRIAKFMVALGGMSDAHQIAHLDCPDGLHYIGLKSNTYSRVSNKVGANIVREYGSLWKDKLKQRSPEVLESTAQNQGLLGRPVRGRDAKRKVNVFILKVGSQTKEEPRVVLKAGKGGPFLLGWLPLLLTIGVVAGSCISCKQWFVAGLIILGTLGMMLAVLGLRLCLFKYSIPEETVGVPLGDCLVMDDTDVDTLHIILGEESIIQAVFQRKINCQLSLGCKYVLLLAGSLLAVYVVASILYLPNVSLSGQLLFAMANLIGFVTDMVKASKNGNLDLAKKACEEFNIEAKDLLVFGNRAAAVAFVATYAEDCNLLSSKNLLPCHGPVWSKWWQELAKRIDEAHNTSDHSLEEQKYNGFYQIVLEDMANGLDTKLTWQL